MPDFENFYNEEFIYISFIAEVMAPYLTKTEVNRKVVCNLLEILFQRSRIGEEHACSEDTYE